MTLHLKILSGPYLKTAKCRMLILGKDIEVLKWTRVQAKTASYTKARVLVRSPSCDLDQFCPSSISETVRCRKLILSMDIGWGCRCVTFWGDLDVTFNFCSDKFLRHISITKICCNWLLHVLLPKCTISFARNASVEILLLHNLECLINDAILLLICLFYSLSLHIYCLTCYFLLHLYITYTVYSESLLAFILFLLFYISWCAMLFPQATGYRHLSSVGWRGEVCSNNRRRLTFSNDRLFSLNLTFPNSSQYPHIFTSFR